jgi:type IV pilus assembly protein PilX
MIANISTNSEARLIFSNHKSDNFSQRGITLIMVLIFIVTLSLIAAVGMRGVMTAERVVANERDRALAFQAAESTAREAVTLIASGTGYTTIGVLPLGGNTEHWRTTSGLTAAAACTPIPLMSAATTRYNWTLDGVGCSTKSANTTKYGNAAEPRYVIELMPTVPLPGGTKAECWYRITARATGGTQEADVILQAMFSREIPLPGVCS